MNQLIDIVYEDQGYIVFNKPSGIVVIPTPKKETRTLVSLVNQQFKQADCLLHPCHRLDRDTSGLIIFAKGKKHQQWMMNCFKERKISKRYIALVQGCLDKKKGSFLKSIKDFDSRKYGGGGKPQKAETQYSVLETKNDFSVVSVVPVTGRTNQIRIHFAEAGHPLLGERKYSFAKDYKLKFRRTALHAQRLEWDSPFESKKIIIHIPLPDDMNSFLKQCKLNINLDHKS